MNNYEDDTKIISSKNIIPNRFNDLDNSKELLTQGRKSFVSYTLSNCQIKFTFLTKKLI